MLMGSKRIYIENHGCYRRSMDSLRIKEYFSQNNCHVIDSPKKADYIVLVTCGMFKETEEVNINRIKEIVRKY